MAPLIVLQDCATVQLTNGSNTLIDAAEFSRFADVRCYAYWDRHTSYALCKARDASTNRRLTSRLHRLIVNAGRLQQVDHRDGDGLNNTRSNLRLCTAAENAQNARPREDGRSKYKGVFPSKNGKRWRAQVRIGGAHTGLGTFDTEEQAARAYDRAAREHYGEFAKTNAEIFGLS